MRVQVSEILNRFSLSLLIRTIFPYFMKIIKKILNIFIDIAPEIYGVISFFLIVVQGLNLNFNFFQFFVPLYFLFNSYIFFRALFSTMEKNERKFSYFVFCFGLVVHYIICIAIFQHKILDFGFILISISVVILGFLFFRCIEMGGLEALFNYVHFVVIQQNYIPGTLSLGVIFELITIHLKNYRQGRFTCSNLFGFCHWQFAWFIFFLAICQILLERFIIVVLVALCYQTWHIIIYDGYFQGILFFCCVVLHLICITLLIYSLPINKFILLFINLYFDGIIFGWIGLYPNFQILGDFPPYTYEEKLDRKKNKFK